MPGEARGSDFYLEYYFFLFENSNNKSITILNEMIKLLF